MFFILSMFGRSCTFQGCLNFLFLVVYGVYVLALGSVLTLTVFIQQLVYVVFLFEDPSDERTAFFDIFLCEVVFGFFLLFLWLWFGVLAFWGQFLTTTFLHASYSPTQHTITKALACIAYPGISLVHLGRKLLNGMMLT